MRAATLGLAASLFAGNALAADYLRGSTYESPGETYQWSGWYVGGQVGYTNVDFGFAGSTRTMVANLVRALLVEQEFSVSGLPNLPGRDARGISFGAFVGYNAQWGDVVLGTELNYNHASIRADTTELIGRSFTTTNEFRNDVLISSNASARLTDFGSLRFRAGYAMGWLMPYATAGLAVGLVNYTRSVNVQIVETDVSQAALDPTDGIPPRAGGALNQIASEVRNGAFAWGFTAGAGVDIGLTKNLFLRAEYEYMYLNPVGGIDFHINTVRAAAGLKF